MCLFWSVEASCVRCFCSFYDQLYNLKKLLVKSCMAERATKEQELSESVPGTHNEQLQRVNMRGGGRFNENHELENVVYT